MSIDALVDRLTPRVIQRATFQESFMPRKPRIRPINPLVPIRITLRVPPHLLAQIASIAERERRPQNTQLLMLIERGLAA